MRAHRVDDAQPAGNRGSIQKRADEIHFRGTPDKYSDIFNKDSYNFYSNHMPDPDPIALEAVRKVFNAPSRAGDPTNGAIFVVNNKRLEEIKNLLDQPEISGIEWKPENNPSSQDTFGVHVFQFQPPTPVPTATPTGTPRPKR